MMSKINDNNESNLNLKDIDTQIINLIIQEGLKISLIARKMVLKFALTILSGLLLNHYLDNNLILISAIVIGLILYFLIDTMQITSEIRMKCTDKFLKSNIDQNYLLNIKNDPRLSYCGSPLIDIIISEMKLRNLKK